MYLKKLLFILLIFLFLIQPLCFADDILSDDELDNFIEVSNDAKETVKEPSTNAKHIIAIDRKTRNCFI